MVTHVKPTPSSLRPAKKALGFTLLELIITLAVLSIGILSAAPSLQQTIIENRLSATSNGIMHSLLLTRSEAVKRNTRVTMRKNGSNWTEGWVVFEDPNNNAIADDSEAILLRHGPLTGKMTLQGNTPVSSYISYTENGQSERISGAMQMGTLTLCRHRKNTDTYSGRSIILSSAGRARVSKKSRSCG